MDAPSAMKAENGISEATKKEKELEEIARLLWAQRKNGVTVKFGKIVVIEPLSGESVSFFKEE